VRLRLAIAFFVFVLLPAAWAQTPGYLTSSNETGFPDYGSFIVSQIDSVNLSNGGVSIRIPIVSRKGRGLDYSFGYRYESKAWVVDSYTLTDPWNQPILRFIWRPNNDFWTASSNVGLWPTGWTEQIYQCPPITWSQPGPRVLIKSNWNAVAPDGTQYQFPVIKPYTLDPQPLCVEYDVQQLKAHSTSGHFEIDITNDGGTTPSLWNVKLRAKDGSMPGSWGSTQWIKDTNGNWCCTLQGGAWTDTLGRPLPGGNSFYDSDGQLRTVQVEWIGLTLSTSFPTADPYPTHCSFDQAPSGTGVNSVKKITLPNGLSYEFFYETWWDTGNPTAQNPYGEVTKVRLPTGGYIKYKFATIAEMDWGPEGAPSFIDCTPMLDARVVVERRVSEDGVNEQVWQYSYAGGITTVTDPLGNVEKHWFTGGKIRLEYKVEYFQGTSTALRRVETTWASDNGPIFARQYTPGQESFGPLGIFDLGARNQRPIRKTTTLLDTNQVTKTETDYDCFTYNIIGSNFTDCRENPTQIREYDYGSGTPGALARYTTFTYLHNVNSTYLNAHIWDRVKERKVYDGGGNLKAQSRFSYDTTTITATSGVPQHDYTSHPYTYTVRGNQTLAETWRNTDGAWLATTNYFNDTGNLIQTTDPGGHTTTFSYTDNYSDGVNRNSQGFVTQMTYPTTNGVSHIERKQYFWYTGLTAAQCGQNFSGSCTNTLTAPQADYAKFTYDLFGRPLTVVRGDGGQTTIAYTEPALPTPANPITLSSTTTISAGQNLVNSALIDGLGRVKQTQLNSNPGCVIKVDTAYDALGRKNTVSNPYCTTGDATYGITKFKYDGLGRTTRVIPPDGNEAGDTNVVKTDYVGATVTVTDQAGKKRKSETDALGRLIRVWEPDAAQSLVHVTRYQYDILDNLLCVHQKSTDATADKACTDATVPATWRPRKFTYNSLSQLLTATNPESGTMSYTYDADGNVLTKVAPAPNQSGSATVTTFFTYDQLHRLNKKSYSDATPLVRYSYDGVAFEGCASALSTVDGIGRRTAMCDGAGTESWSYNLMGQVVTARRTTNSVTKDFTYGYNLAGGVTSIAYPTARTITYAYNAAAQPVSAVDSGGINYATGAVYAAHGGLASLTNGASLVSTYFYNTRLQPCRISVRTAGVSPANCADATNVGNVLDFSYGFNLGTANNGNVASIANNRATARSQSFTYDELNRIKTAQTQTTVQPHCWGETFSYDVWGNLLSIGGIQPTYNGCTQENLGVTATTKNQISGYTYDAAGNMTTNPGVGTYTYDAENRMTATAGVTYTYDGDGKRVKKSSGKLYWYGIGSDAMLETDAAGGAPMEFIFFGGKRVARRDAGGAVSYFFADHLGTSRVVTNATGGITEDSDFYPFGGERVVTDLLPDQNYKFTGKERDTESGLDYFGARYYSSTSGRFLTPDWAASPTAVPYAELSDPQTLNLYASARNDPINKVDADGHCPWCIGALVGAAVGAGLETYKQYKAGQGFNIAKIGGKALQGGLVGAVAVATGGSSLLVQGGAVAVANTAGGVVSRATDMDSKTKALNAKQIAVDAAAGAAAGVVGGALGQFARAEASAAQTGLQVEASQANRQIMQGILTDNAAQVSAGQVARSSAELQSTTINAAASALTGAARSAAKAGAVVIVEKVVKPEEKP
jgi:RHS repeat-associated protein